MTKPTPHELYDELLRHNNNDDGGVVKIHTDDIGNSYVYLADEIEFDIGNKSILPLMYAIDHRCKKFFKYENYGHLGDLVTDMMEYMAHAIEHHTPKSPSKRRTLFISYKPH
jgi:hypothetical protein